MTWSRWFHRVAWTLGALVALLLCLELCYRALNGFQMDLTVYRDAGLATLSGDPLYSEDFPTSTGLRFIYPPIAALLFAPMALLDTVALQVLWTALNLGLLAWILWTALVRLAVPRAGWLTLALLAPVLLLEPVRSNFGYGQINIILMALVLADCLGRTPRWLRGAGIGIAAAIKITPAAFGLVLLLRGDRSSIMRAIGAFLCASGLGWLIFPENSLYFWTTEFFKTDRAGDHAYERNQAITGLLARIGTDGPVKDALWLLAATAVVAIAATAGYRFTRAGAHVPAVAVVALATLLAAPIAVTHHWVYVVMLAPLLAAPAHRSWRLALAAVTAVFVVAPYDLMPQRGDGPLETAVRHVAGNLQLLSALVLLILAHLAARSCVQTFPAAAASEDQPRRAAATSAAG